MGENYNNHSEIWKDIKGYEGLYQVSNLGKVRSLDRKIKNKHGFRTIKGQLINPFMWGAGYLYVNLHKEQMRISKSVHRLVAEAFLPNEEGKPEVNHKDGDKKNNKADNLEWATSSENEKHAYNSGLIPITWGNKIKCTNSLTGVEKLFNSCDSACSFLGLAKGTVSCALKRRGGTSGIVSFGNYKVERI